MFMQFPKYKLQRKPLLKTLNRTQPRFKAIYMRGQAETMSNQLMSNFLTKCSLNLPEKQRTV